MAASRRDRAHHGYDTAYLLSPVAPQVIAALPRALSELVARDVMGMVGRLRSHDREPRAAVDGPLHLSADLSDLELLQRVRAAGYGGSPVAIGVSGDRVAVLVPHELADGTESVALLEALLTLATGAQPPEAPRPVRLPVLRAIRSTGLAPFRTYLRERSTRPPVVPGTTTRTDPGMASLTLTGADLVAVKRGRSSGGRATISTRLASIAVATMLAVARDDRVAALCVPIDLRFAVGGRVAGNFVHGVELGAVDDSWTPGALNAAIATKRATVVPAMVFGLARPRGFAARRHTSWAQRLTLTVSMMRAPELPDTFWSTSATADRRLAVLSLSENADLAVVVAMAGDAAYVTVIDATGWSDVERFADAFRAEIGSRRVPTT